MGVIGTVAEVVREGMPYRDSSTGPAWPLEARSVRRSQSRSGGRRLAAATRDRRPRQGRASRPPSAAPEKSLGRLNRTCIAGSTIRSNGSAALSRLSVQ